MWEKLIDDNRPPAPLRISTVLSRGRGPSLEVHWKLHVGCTAKILVQKL